MKATSLQSTNKTHRLIKTTVLVAVTILTLSGGTAYASHRHHGQHSGASISFDSLYYPGLHLSYSNSSHPRHYRRYNHYSGRHGHHERYSHGYRHGRGHGNKHGNKHARKHHNGHRGH